MPETTGTNFDGCNTKILNMTFVTKIVSSQLEFNLKSKFAYKQVKSLLPRIKYTNIHVPHLIRTCVVLLG